MKGKNLAAGMVPLVLLAGCAGGASGGSATSSSASAIASPSLDEQALIAEGTEAIRAFRQTIFDIYADPVPDLDSLNSVMAPGKRQIRTLDALRKDLAKGWTANPGTVEVRWVKPVSVQADSMRLYACVDPNGIRVSQLDEKGRARYRSGSFWSSAALDYALVRQVPGWVVKDTLGHVDPSKVTPC